LALVNAGNSSPANMAMMAITTRSSIKVNARRRASFLSQASEFTSLKFLISAPVVAEIDDCLGLCRADYPSLLVTSTVRFEAHFCGAHVRF
jgi:hypothetical protein